jgi:hypothetical protein
VPDHPTKEHVEPLAGTLSSGGGYVLLRALWGIGQREKQCLEARQAISNISVRRHCFFQKSRFQRIVVLVIPLEEFQKIQRIGRLKSAVLEPQEAFAVVFLVVFDKIVGRPVHQPEELGGIVDDGLSLAPGKHGRPEGRDFDVLFFEKTVWDANRVVFYEIRAVVPPHRVVEEIFQVRFCHFIKTIVCKASKEKG